MARQFFAILSGLGHDVRLISRLRTRLREPSDLATVESASLHEIVTLRAEFKAWKPELWFTYHLYYKAPDLLGPVLAAELGIPYVAAEASYAPKRAVGEWAEAHRLATAAIAGADLLFAMTGRDAQGLSALDGRKGRLVSLKPFLADAGPEPSPRAARPGGVRLLTVAMMREGGKLASYRMLAEALAPIRHLPWQLGIVGDGAARASVELAFGGYEPGRITWHGLQASGQVRELMAGSDLFVWPGHNEPYGLVYLEAAACGLASAAMASGGVPDVVVDGQTGLLAPHGDAGALGAVIARLIGNHGLRGRLGKAAREMVRTERTAANASLVIARALADLETAHGR